MSFMLDVSVCVEFYACAEVVLWWHAKCRSFYKNNSSACN